VFELTSSIAAPFALALALSLAFVPIARLIATRLGYVAKPREDRWHKRPVAMFGGAAIAASLFVCIAVFGIGRELAVLVGAATMMFLVGFVDDVLSLKPSTKLIAQIAGASVLLFFGYRLNWLHSETLDTILTLVWVVGMTNAFNLLDNMDGLCGGIAMIVGASLLVGMLPGANLHTFAEARYLAMLLGAVGGFLVYNVHPASIFMGDSGALLLGFSFAAVTLSSAGTSAGRSDVLSIVAAPVLVLLIPIFDTTLVTLSRWFRGRRASQGGRDHSSHRLVAIGLSERAAVALLWLLAAIGGALGIAIDFRSQSWTAGAAGFAFVVGMALFAVYLAGIRVYDDGDATPESGVTPLVVEFMHKRRVAEVLLDSALVSLCYYVAYRLRFEDPHDFAKNFEMFQRSFPIVVAAQMIAFFAVGVYRGVWRHFGLIDSLAIARGVFFGALTAQLFITYVRYFQFFAYSRTVFAIYAVLVLITVALSRASFRLVGEFVQRQKRSGTRVVIYGAGDAGGLVIRELLNQDADNRLVGFVDDDPRKAGIRVMGYPVVGGYSALTVLINSSSVDAIVISARTMPPERLHNLTTLCSERGIRLSRLRVGLESLVESEDAAVTKPARTATIHQIKH
jgi:UDP-GlcNAc:undecaprenyl-phosphate/decaprenyl-phosphate GlcNAc-1-phosphate transferase